MANSANEFQIVLQTILDSNAKNNIQSELQKLNDLSITIKKAKLDNSAIKEIQSQLSAINLNISLNDTGKMVEEATRLGQEVREALNEGMSEGAKDTTIMASSEEIDKLHQKLVKLNESNTQGVKDYQTEIQNMVESTKSGSELSAAELQKLRDRYLEINTAISQSNKAYESNQKAAQKAYNQLGEGAEVYVAKVNNLTTGLSKWGEAANQAGVDTQGLQQALADTQTAEAEWSADKTSDEKAQTLVDDFEKLKAKLEECQVQLNTWNKGMASDSSIEKLHTEILNFVTDSDTAMARYGDALSEMLSKTQSGAVLSASELKQITSELKQIETACGTAGTAATSFFSQLSKGVAQLVGFGSAVQSLRTLTRIFTNISDTVVDLDTALIDLKKTTTMTSDELMDFYYDANDVAKEMGVTTEEIISQAAAWSRLGYSSKDAATEMAALSSQFAQISPGMDVDEATDGLIAVMKAYDVDVSDVLDGVMSKINAVGNTAATTNEEIVDMLERSSSAMAVANTSMEQTIALETAALRQFNAYGWMYRNVHHRTHLIAENA